MTDNVHDPGPAVAAATFDGPSDIAANPLDIKGGGAIRIGTASWTDPTMTASGVFYPNGADSAEERLQFYASRFPTRLVLGRNRTFRGAGSSGRAR